VSLWAAASCVLAVFHGNSLGLDKMGVIAIVLCPLSASLGVGGFSVMSVNLAPMLSAKPRRILEKMFSAFSGYGIPPALTKTDSLEHCTQCIRSKDRWLGSFIQQSHCITLSRFLDEVGKMSALQCSDDE